MQDVSNALTQPFAPELIRQRKGQNGITLSYIEAHNVIKRLIEATGNQFNFRVLGIDIQDGLVMATVRLSIDQLGDREHIGTQRMNGGNDDDCVKAAISDAIKKCATLFGVALELYGTDPEPTKGYQGEGQRTRPAPATRQTAYRPMPQED